MKLYEIRIGVVLPDHVDQDEMLESFERLVTEHQFRRDVWAVIDVKTKDVDNSVDVRDELNKLI